MPTSVFISYSHDPDDPTQAQRVARLAASLIRDGLRVFFDQNREADDEKLPWPIWMEGKIKSADHVLVVCTRLYDQKIRQDVDPATGRGSHGSQPHLQLSLRIEAEYLEVRTGIVLAVGRAIHPGPARRSLHFLLGSDSAYLQLYAFLTKQHRALFPQQGTEIVALAQRVIEPSFASPLTAALPVASPLPVVSAAPLSTSGLALRQRSVPVPRRDIRGLDWYDECDAAHFLGRDETVNSLLAMLLSLPVVRLVGPSGVGKSSLIRAGLLPKVREFGWRACVLRPFGDPTKHLPSQLNVNLLAGPGSFTAPLDPVKIPDGDRRRSSSVRGRAASSCSSTSSKTSYRLRLRRARSTRCGYGYASSGKTTTQKPYLRAMVSYRTDSEARLGRLWQEISGRSDSESPLATSRSKA